MIMKKINLVSAFTALILSAVVVYADGVNFTTVTSWNQALELAAKS